MKITALMENTASREGLITAHGLSLYIKTAKRNILFDSGPNGDFAENAKKLGIDLEKVELFILSHGHYDHGGGLRKFIEVNGNAPIYLQSRAFEPHYAVSSVERRYNGLDKTLKYSSRYVFNDGVLKIDGGLTLFSGVDGRDCYSHANDTLFSEVNGELVKDEFLHEQSLLIEENGKYTLVGGCAHCGIVNIIDKCKEITGIIPDYAISGFHLYNPSLKKSEPADIIDKLSEKLLSYGTKFFTCHCTGEEAFERLKARMNDKIEYLACGDTAELV